MIADAMIACDVTSMKKISICNKSMYCKISNISLTKTQNFSVSRLGFKLTCA